MNKFEKQAVRELAVSAGRFFGGALMGGLGAVVVIYVCLRGGLTELETISVLGITVLGLMMADTVRSMYRSKVRELEYQDKIKNVLPK